MNRQAQPRVLGRYLFYAPIAAGGMATVYLGRMAGPKGFSRIVAIKQLHSQFVHDTDFVTMFLDEAHLIGRIHHSNVVAPIDVLEADGDLCIVMEYVHGEALGRLMRLSRQDRMPLRIVSAIMTQTLLGLHAAHEVTDVNGKPLAIVHRDVSPQNILVGEDGIARVVDFGIAQAAHRANASDIGKLKGKLGYMAPEQLLLKEIDRRCDIFAAGIILWEMLTGKKLFSPDGPAEAAERMLTFEAKSPSLIVPTLSAELAAIPVRALSVEPEARFAHALEMAKALEEACPPASAMEVATWMTQLVGDTLRTRAEWIADLSSMDLGEWTQTYVMSSSLPLVVSSAPPPPSTVENSLPSPAPPPSTVENSLPSVAPPAASQCTTAHRIEPAPPNALFTVLKTYPRRLLWILPALLLGVLLTSFGLWRRVNAASMQHPASTFAAQPHGSSGSGSASAVGSAASVSGANGPGAASSESTTGDANSESTAPIGAASGSGNSESTTGAASSQSTALIAPASAAASSEHATGAVGSESTTPNTNTNAAAVVPKRAGASPNCKVPYYYDKQRIKRFKAECFKKH